MKYLSSLLDRITMYRLVVYVLLTLIALASGFSLAGRLPFSPTVMVVSLGLLIVPAYAVDKLLSYVFKVPTNSESWLITALILFLILKPAQSAVTGLALVLAGGVSSASKFLLTWRNKHLFNPAAFAAAFVSLAGLASTTWWIGSSLFWPFTLVLGIAVVQKIRRLPLFITFVVVAVALQLVLFVGDGQPLVAGIKGAVLASPLLFLGTIMLTEPATMPPRRYQQLVFASLVAVLYITAWQIGPLTIYPEVALLLGNLYAFMVTPKFRARLQLTKIQRISDRVYNYVFQSDQTPRFLPGQYMEWTLAGVPFNSRGNRRTFTLASSPTEPNVQVGIKYYEPASDYKALFGRMRLGDSVFVSQLAGNFTINFHANNKLAFIAGGIGVTPFRSIIKYLIDMNLHRDIVLLYAVPEAAELAYMDDFIAAKQHGVTVIPIVTRTAAVNKGVINARLSQKLIAQLIPDYAERTFYVSGPSNMVDATKGYIQALGVPVKRITTDHFSGY